MNSRINNDNDLLALLKGGDEEAFRLLFEKYNSRLYLFSLKFLGKKEDAEDLLSEVFLKIWQNRKSLKTNLSFQSYLFTIAYNGIRQRFLKKSREERYIQIFAEEYLIAPSEEEHVNYHEFINEFNRVMELLPPRRKEIFHLSYKEELKNGVIAEQLGVSEQFIKKQLSIARKFIIKQMKDDNRLAGILFLYLFINKTNLD